MEPAKKEARIRIEAPRAEEAVLTGDKAARPSIGAGWSFLVFLSCLLSAGGIYLAFFTT